MSRVFNEAGDAEDITKFGDSTELDSRPLKKAKSDQEAEGGEGAKAKTDPEAEAEVHPEMRVLRRGNWNDPEYARQRMIFEEQFKKSEGYDVDWDSTDYYFPAIKFEWREYYDDHLSNKEYMDLLLIETAIKEETEENGTNLKFVKYVSANVVSVAGFLFYITFLAQDLSSPNTEPKCYQAEVRKFSKLIKVIDFRLKPT